MEEYTSLFERMEIAYNALHTQPHGQLRDNIISSWCELIDKNIEEKIQDLNITLMHPDLGVGEKQRIQTLLAQFQSWRVKFQDLQQRGTNAVTGGGHNSGGNIEHRVQWDDVASAFNSRIRTGVITNMGHIDLGAFLTDAGEMAIEHLQTALRTEGNIKANVILSCRFQNVKDDVTYTEVKYFNTRNAVIYPSTELNEWFSTNVRDKLLVEVEDFEHRDSGWSLLEVINLVVNINHHQPLNGGQSTFTELPKDIQRRKAVVNIQNTDDRCFLWAVTAARHPARCNATRTASYRAHINELNSTGIKFPTTLRDVEKFEKLNNLRINVYGIESENFSNHSKSEKSVIVPLYLSKNLTNSAEEVIHLLMISADRDTNHGDDDDLANFQPRFHFTWIKNVSRLVTSQLSRHDGAALLCDRCLCLCHFAVASSFEKHQLDCTQLNKVRMIFSENNTNLEFKNFRNKGRVPFVVYADLECILKPGANESQEHIPHSAGYYVHCSYDEKLSGYTSRRGPDCIEWFVNQLRDLAMLVESRIKNVIPMIPLNQVQRDRHARAKDCYICLKPFSPDDKKCHDHCHFTCIYRGPAHNGCNLNFKESQTIPVVFHNFSGYDSHFIIKSLATTYPGEITLLPINKEKYISFTKRVDGTFMHLRFIDSLRFMASSLDKLASYIDDAGKKITRTFYSDREEFQCMKQKGIFPYEHIQSWENLEESSLPTKEQFFSKLNDSGISDAEYEHAKNVWSKFNLKTLGEYSDLYLKTDVLLLADIFENFRESCFETYELDPLHYYTAPGLAFDAMLRRLDTALTGRAVRGVSLCLYTGPVSGSQRHLGAIKNKIYFEK